MVVKPPVRRPRLLKVAAACGILALLAPLLVGIGWRVCIGPHEARETFFLAGGLLAWLLLTAGLICWFIASEALTRWALIGGYLTLVIGGYLSALFAQNACVRDAVRRELYCSDCPFYVRYQDATPERLQLLKAAGVHFEVLSAEAELHAEESTEYGYRRGYPQSYIEAATVAWPFLVRVRYFTRCMPREFEGGDQLYFCFLGIRIYIGRQVYIET